MRGLHGVFQPSDVAALGDILDEIFIGDETRDERETVASRLLQLYQSGTRSREQLVDIARSLHRPA